MQITSIPTTTLPSEIIWLTFEDVSAAHQEGLAGREGSDGIRDQNAIESAIQAPRNLYEIEGEDDVLVLAIRLMARIESAQGFVDGNKRAALSSMELFLYKNGYRVRVDTAPDFRGATRLSRWVWDLADRRLTEDEFYDKIVEFVTPLEWYERYADQGQIDINLACSAWSTALGEDDHGVQGFQMPKATGVAWIKSSNLNSGNFFLGPDRTIRFFSRPDDKDEPA